MDIWGAYYCSKAGEGTIDSAASRVTMGCVAPRDQGVAEATGVFASVTSIPATQQQESSSQVIKFLVELLFPILNLLCHVYRYL